MADTDVFGADKLRRVLNDARRALIHGLNPPDIEWWSDEMSRLWWSLDLPNAEYNWADFWHLLNRDYTLTGQFLMWRRENTTSGVIEVHRLPVALTVPMPASLEFPHGHYRVWKCNRYDGAIERVVPAEDVMRVTRPMRPDDQLQYHPWNEFRRYGLTTQVPLAESAEKPVSDPAKPTLCVNCKHHRVSGTGEIWYQHECVAPAVRTETMNYVTGKIDRKNREYCSQMNKEGKCEHYDAK